MSEASEAQRCGEKKITEKVPSYRVAVSCKSKAQTLQGDLSDILLLEDSGDEHDTTRLPTD